MNRLTTEEFVRRAKEIHGEKYDYSNCIYTTAKAKMGIFCNSCENVFYKNPDKHIGTYQEGCSICSVRAVYTTETWIKKAKKKLGNRYDYSKFVFKYAAEKAEFICNTCGDTFWQEPFIHMRGIGCPNCGGNKRITVEEFVKRSKAIHGEETYCYDQITSIKNTKSKVTLTCNECSNTFEQNVGNHIVGTGCPSCCNGRSISDSEREWLDHLGVPESNRHIHVKLPTRRVIVDGIIDNIVYEFYGDYWHGNPNIYGRDEINKKVKLTFGELYDKTMVREQLLRENGYQLVTIWEDEWYKLKQIAKTTQSEDRIVDVSV